MKKLTTQVLLALGLALAAAGCGSTREETGRVQLAATLRQSLATGDVARLSVTSSGPDMPSISVELVQTASVWGGIIGNLPAGADRSFLAEAFDAAGTKIFEGEATGVTILAGETALVAITLMEVPPPAPFENEAPLLGSLVASSTTVPVGSSITLTATAMDPNVEDTLSFAWVATGGTFSDPAATLTTWTAPTEPGVQTITFTVTDDGGLAVTAALTVHVVAADAGEGEAEIVISFNSLPRVTGINLAPARLAVDESTTVTVSATDPDGDALTYSWSADCAGDWTDAAASSTAFTPTALPAGACNNCRLTVTVLDERGGAMTGTVALCVSEDPSSTEHLPPVIVRSYRSSNTATPGQTLTFQVDASDPEGSALSFSWSANVGTPGAPLETATSSRITWVAPACVDAGVTPAITFTATNAFGKTATRVFNPTGLPGCGPLPPGSWTLKGATAAGRYLHAALLLPSGKVLVAGGQGLASAELYDPATGAWTPTGSMNTVRDRFTLTLLPSGKVLAAGGAGGADFSTAELYDPATGTWTPTTSMNTWRFVHTATLLPSGEVLVAGGNFLAGSPTAETYDPATETWTVTSPMQAGPRRWNHTAILLGSGQVLVAGGMDASSTVMSSAELYDPATNSWSFTGSMSLARDSHAMVRLAGGRVLVVAGRIAGGSTAGAELYDPATGLWTPTAPISVARHYVTATVLPSGRVLVTGGSPPSFSTAEIYDPTTSTWSLTDSMLSPRHSHTATLLPSGQVLAVGGMNGTILTSTELYTP